MLVYVRPSNEALLRARVPGAQDQRGCPSNPFHRGGSASRRDGAAPSSTQIFLSLSNLARRDSTGGAVLWILSSSFPLWWPVVFFGQVAGLGQTARVHCPSFLPLLIPVAVRSKGPVGGLPHRARIGRALFHRARSASTGAPTCSPPLFPFPLFLAGAHSITKGQGWEALGA